eukprot:5125336-Alexandrium_andersonii.AAC.1
MWPAGVASAQLCVPPTPAPPSSGPRHRRRAKRPRIEQAVLTAPGSTLGGARDAMERMPWGQPGTPASLLPVWPAM